MQRSQRRTTRKASKKYKKETGLAQLVEHQAFNLRVAGSTPATGTFFIVF